MLGNRLRTYGPEDSLLLGRETGSPDGGLETWGT